MPGPDLDEYGIPKQLFQPGDVQRPGCTMPGAQVGGIGEGQVEKDIFGYARVSNPPCPAKIEGCPGERADGCACQIPKDEWKKCLTDLEVKAIEAGRPPELSIDPESLGALLRGYFKGWHIAISLDHSQNTIILVRAANGHGGNRGKVHELAAHIYLEAFKK
jgi:hypothetical protein